MDRQTLLARTQDDLRAYFQQLDSRLSITSLTLQPLSSDRVQFVCMASQGKRSRGTYSGLAGYEDDMFFVTGLQYTKNESSPSSS